MADIAETRASTSREESELQTASEQLALQKTRCQWRPRRDWWL